MANPPIEIPDLDPAGPVNGASDQLIIRQGLNDKRITPDNLFSFQLATYANLPSQIVPSDVILVGRNNGSGYTNFIADPRRLGFLSGVFMWFYCDVAQIPLYWSNVPALGDRLLAVKGGSQMYTNQGPQGDWQQNDHTLTLAQIPAHKHTFTIRKSQTSGNGSFNRIGASESKTTYGAETDNAGGGLGHNHGAIWRPAAAVGLVCQKTG